MVTATLQLKGKKNVWLWKCGLPQLMSGDYDLCWCNTCFSPLPFVQQL